MSQIAAFLTLFKQGHELANAKAWKEKTIAANIAALIAALVVIFNGMGYELHLDDPTIQALSLGIWALGNVVMAIITSAKVGVAGKPMNDEKDAVIK